MARKKEFNLVRAQSITHSITFVYNRNVGKHTPGYISKLQ